MSAESWFWLTIIVLATAFCVNEARKLLALPEYWLRQVSSLYGPREGEDGPEEQAR
jgi:hypothetical protein